MSQPFMIRFWGVRGGYPTPGPATVGYGGNTSCVEVQVAGHTIILDAGTGLIALGDELLRRAAATREPIRALILFSHTHADHTQGLPFFRPAYQGGNRFHLFGPQFSPYGLTDTLRHLMAPHQFPVDLADLAADLVIQEVHEPHQLYLWPGSDEVTVRHRFTEPQPERADEAVRVDLYKSYSHPRLGVLCYRIGYQGRSVVYATDTEGYRGGDQKLALFARGTDLLIHDAQYTDSEYSDPQDPRQGWGHSTPSMAVEVAELAGAKRLSLFHHDPLHDDDQLAEIERAMQARFPACCIAREGHVLRLDGA